MLKNIYINNNKRKNGLWEEAPYCNFLNVSKYREL